MVFLLHQPIQPEFPFWPSVSVLYSQPPPLVPAKGQRQGKSIDRIPGAVMEVLEHYAGNPGAQ
jgi:hypothetical protein